MKLAIIYTLENGDVVAHRGILDDRVPIVVPPIGASIRLESKEYSVLGVVQHLKLDNDNTTIIEQRTGIVIRKKDSSFADVMQSF